MEDIIEIELKSFEKYKARSDVKKPTWFKCSNDLFDDDDLYAFSLEEMAVWTYILAQSSKQQAKRVRLSIRKASIRISPELLRGTIAKLTALGIVTPTVRTRNADGTPTDGSNTPDRRGFIGLEEIGGEETDPAAPPPGVSLKGAIQELRGNPAVEFALSQVPTLQQEAWLGAYDPGWLRESLVRAITHGLKRDGVDAPQGINNWHKRLDSWFAREQRPKLRPKRPEPRARAAPPDIEIPVLTREEVLSSASKVKLGVVAKLALTRGLGA